MKDVPKRVIVNTGDQHQSYERMDEFFLETFYYLKNKCGASDSVFERRYRGLISENGAFLDESVAYLDCNGIPTAIVLETRTPWNYICLTFSRELEDLAEDVPSRKIVTSGERSDIEELIASFFEEAKEKLLGDYSALPFRIKQEHRTLVDDKEEGYNDKLLYLAHDEIPVAMVLATNINPDKVCYTFFKNFDLINPEKIDSF